MAYREFRLEEQSEQLLAREMHVVWKEIIVPFRTLLGSGVLPSSFGTASCDSTSLRREGNHGGF